jgi:hypothetical protein
MSVLQTTDAQLYTNGSSVTILYCFFAAMLSALVDASAAGSAAQKRAGSSCAHKLC